MKYETYTTTELELLIANGTSAAKTLRSQDNIIGAASVEETVAKMINELTARHIAALEI